MPDQLSREELIAKMAILMEQVKYIEALEKRVAALEEKSKEVEVIKVTVERVQETVNSVDKKIGELLEALVGNLKTKGLVARVLEIETYVMGSNGIGAQVMSLKETRTKFFAWAAGATFVTTGFCSIILFILEHFVFKAHP